MTYQPELGQLTFGQPWQPNDATPALLGALAAMAQTWSVVRGDANPFTNSGERYDGKAFRAHAYSWNDEEKQEWNLCWRDLRVSWYKHAQRGASANRMVSYEEAAEMLRECLPEILEFRQ